MLTVAPFSRVAYLKATSTATKYVGLSFLYFLEWGGDCNSVFSHVPVEELSRLHSSIIVSNHVNSYDWLVVAWVVMHAGFLANIRALAKKSLAWIPVMGWTWYLTDFIFLTRSMTSDKKKIQQGVSHITNASRGGLLGRVPFWVVIFPEGTRSSAAGKMQESIEFQKSKGIEPLKHLLYPRTGGMIQVCQGLDEEVEDIYSFTVCYPEDCPRPTQLLAGKGSDISINVRRIKLSNFKGEDNVEVLKERIVDVFRSKDQVLERYKNGTPFAEPELWKGEGKQYSTLVIPVLINIAVHSTLSYLTFLFSPTAFTVCSSAYLAVILGCGIAL